ncbi:hypothetical protein HPP92_008668 [Vanilla planifolia]|uniref:Uncharacterized protein n=1 Tax=Vanilla planifolia TaxID=51239 RepID=A0A835R988_VANPL|nr:hypothetical protein HPP92_008668 [Vanilla planifolia]
MNVYNALGLETEDFKELQLLLDLVYEAMVKVDSLGREPLRPVSFAAGLGTGREWLEADLLAEIQKYLDDLLNSGLRQRLIAIIKELNRDEPAGCGGPHVECYVIDSEAPLLIEALFVMKDCFLVTALFYLDSEKTEFHKSVMASGNNHNVEQFVDVVRLAWVVHMIYSQDEGTTREASSGFESVDLTNVSACLEIICTRNVFPLSAG